MLRNGMRARETKTDFELTRKMLETLSNLLEGLLHSETLETVSGFESKNFNFLSQKS